ncbi:MAG: glycine oxidase [Paracoccaceae bacterium]|jgi:glycine oxidase
MATVDVTVRGAGIFGLSCAWLMVQRGAKVRVIDPFGVGAGSSGGIVGALAPHTPDRWNTKKAFQFDSLIAAQGFWTAVEAASGLSAGYARLGRLQPLADERAVALARARQADADENWKGLATWRVIAAQDVDWAPPTPSGWLVKDTLSGRVHPMQACQALAAAITARGGQITRDEARDEGRVLWATGVAGLEALSARLATNVGNGVKGQAALFALDRCDLPQLFCDGVHIVPHADGTTAVGSTSERDYDDGHSTDALLEALIVKARALCPDLAQVPVIQRWAGVRPRAKSRAPLLGGWPERAGHFVANGGFKIGFGMAPAIATVMADLVLDDLDRVPPEFRFDLPR